MISSQYNLYIPSSRPGDYILYNTLKGSIFLINENAKIAIENGGYGLNKKLNDTLIKDGILRIDDTDEINIFQVLRNRVKYCSKTMSIVILSTYICNLSCTYCFLPLLWKQWHKNIPNKSMSEKTIQSISTFVKNSAQENNYDEISIDFVGLGEPLLKPDIILNLINKLNSFTTKKNITLKTNIVSNGTLITKELLEQLCGYDIRFQITVDGPKAIHNKRRMFKNNTGTYNRILESLELLSKFGVPYIIRVNIDKDNIENVEDLLDNLTIKLGTGLHVRFLPVLPIQNGNYTWINSCIAREDLSEIPRLWELASIKGFIVHLAPLINYISCKAMSDSSYVIDLFGDVYKCEGLVGNEKFKIGTISENGKLLRIADTYYKWMVINPLNTEDCRRCTLLPTCGGACPQLEYLDSGKCQQEHCTKNKNFLIQNIQFQLKRFLTNIS